MIEKLVSVIIPSFKMGQFIGEALESVGAQTYQHWEVIVVDDAGPEDGTRAAVEAFAAKHADHRVEYLRHEVNRGVSAARNTAIGVARGGLLAFLDPDDAWFPEHLATHVELQRSSPGTRLVSATCAQMFERERGDRNLALWGYSEAEREMFPFALALRNAMNPSAVVTSRAGDDDALRFDEAADLQHVEDWDLWFSLVTRGWEFVPSSAVTVWYRKHAAGATASQREVLRRLEALAAKNHGVWVPLLAEAACRINHRLESVEGRLGATDRLLVFRFERWLRGLARKILRR
jgi:glycosyltransferase involved in cell wall biosynthesis